MHIVDATATTIITITIKVQKGVLALVLVLLCE